MREDLEPSNDYTARMSCHPEGLQLFDHQKTHSKWLTILLHQLGYQTSINNPHDLSKPAAWTFIEDDHCHILYSCQPARFRQLKYNTVRMYMRETQCESEILFS